jgi:hypothetical protein
VKGKETNISMMVNGRPRDESILLECVSSVLINKFIDESIYMMLSLLFVGN